MGTLITTIGILLFFNVLYLLQDTITEFLCKGKSFVNDENKPFR